MNSLAHAGLPPPRLPPGARDWLPRAAARRRAIAGALVRTFERSGYSRVIAPLIEYEEVIARGLGDGRGLVRFVEAGSGEVAVLRPDITPQVARMVAGRMGEEPRPIRLCYEGSVLRLAPGARAQRELFQAGAELFDAPAPGGDIEAVRLCAEALRAAGLSRLTVELGHPGPAREALGDLPEPLREPARACLARKAAGELGEIAARARVAPRARRRLAALCDLFGGVETIARARALCGPHGRRAAAEVAAVARAIGGRLGGGVELIVDLGDPRGFDYYSGVRFAVYARAGGPGAPGEPLASGGRYDTLVGRFGGAARATGFAIDVEACAVALRAGGARVPRPGGTVCGGALGERLAGALRRRGERAATAPGALAALVRHAAAWGFARAIHAGPRGGLAAPVTGGAARRLSAAAVARMLGPDRGRRGRGRSARGKASR